MVMKVSEDKKTLTMIVDLEDNMGPSKSGKTILVDSTRGLYWNEDAQVWINMNVTRKR
jgi:hypothetical protein